MSILSIKPQFIKLSLLELGLINFKMASTLILDLLGPWKLLLTLLSIVDRLSLFGEAPTLLVIDVQRANYNTLADVLSRCFIQDLHFNHELAGLINVSLGGASWLMQPPDDLNSFVAAVLF